MPYQPALEEVLEDSIVTALSALKPLCEVSYFSDVNSDFNSAFSKPRVSAMVHSGKSGELLDTNEALSEESIFVQLCLESRSRRGANGIYDLKRQVLAMINGLKLDNWDRLIYADFKYSERTSNGVWIYNVLFTTKQVNQQVVVDGYLEFPLQIGL